MAEADVRAARERLLDYWTRMSVEMEGCPIPTEACQAIGCNDGGGCWFDEAIRALVAAHVDAGVRGERARAIEECAQVVMRQRARNDGGIVTIQAANHALRVAAECIRELLPPAGHEEKQHA